MWPGNEGSRCGLAMRPGNEASCCGLGMRLVGVDWE